MQFSDFKNDHILLVAFASCHKYRNDNAANKSIKMHIVKEININEISIFSNKITFDTYIDNDRKNPAKTRISNYSYIIYLIFVLITNI
jgi:hypothetical protein